VGDEQRAIKLAEDWVLSVYPNGVKTNDAHAQQVGNTPIWQVDFIQGPKDYYSVKVDISGLDMEEESEDACQPNPDGLFNKELTQLINKYSKENNSGTPDFILATYLDGCLKLWEMSIQHREKWYGRSLNVNSNELNSDSESA